MTMRTTCRTVIFKHPFSLAGLDGLQPAGTYVVETSEELLDGISFPAWMRRSTVLRLQPRSGLTLTAPINPDELAAKLLWDGASLDLACPDPRFESPVRQTHRSEMKIFLDATRAIQIRCKAQEPSTDARRDERRTVSETDGTAA